MERDKNLAPRTDRLPLMESGLDSLCIETIVVRLYDQMNAEPFGGAASEMPVTIGDRIRIYENAFT